MERDEARKSLMVFFGFLVPLAGLAHVLVIRNGMTLPLVAYAMWTPAIASVLAAALIWYWYRKRMYGRDGTTDVDWGSRRIC